MLYGKHLLYFLNTCTFFKIFTRQLATFLILSQSAWTVRLLSSALSAELFDRHSRPIAGLLTWLLSAPKLCSILLSIWP